MHKTWDCEKKAKKKNKIELKQFSSTFIPWVGKVLIAVLTSKLL